MIEKSQVILLILKLLIQTNLDMETGFWTSTNNNRLTTLIKALLFSLFSPRTELPMNFFNELRFLGNRENNIALENMAKMITR